MVNISFILPAYNVSQYIEECVRSIEKQNLDSYEIIIVNDGSKDNTLEIANSLAFKNSCIKVIDQENGGVSSARNAGFNAACGEYVCFCDPDDFYFTDFANDFLKLAKENDLDLIRGQYKNCYDGIVSDIGSLPFSNQNEVLSGREYLKLCLLHNTLEVVPFLSFIKREFLLKNNIDFPIGIGYEEDQIHLLKCLLNNECKVMQTNTYFYAYRQRNSSVTHNAKPKQIYDIIDIINLEEAEIALHGFSKKEINIFNKYVSASFYQITAIYVNLEPEVRAEVYKKIPKRMIINSIKFPIRKRFAIKGLVFLLFPNILIKLRNKI